mmetsp:Transcript_49346/g.56678  ORF Transcript_49346/g.56678 Transcript_49346/m.56678 type:complete len:92 (+) Transcript_49346:45-320(+)
MKLKASNNKMTKKDKQPPNQNKSMIIFKIFVFSSALFPFFSFIFEAFEIVAVTLPSCGFYIFGFAVLSFCQFLFLALCPSFVCYRDKYTSL